MTNIKNWELCEGTVRLIVDSFLALNSPCPLIGLRIYCNAIVLDRIDPVLTRMMPSSVNLEALLEAVHLDGCTHRGGGVYT